MKKCLFTNKTTNQAIECMVGNIGALVYNICNDVKSMNDVIRWCNSHKVGDEFDCEEYSVCLVDDNVGETKSEKEETNNEKLSPILKQFYELKAKHIDAVLLFRCGDFYETYGEDAEDASKILGITLTKSIKRKDKDGKPLKMAGFPHHALDTYLPKLIRAGKRVAICDQLENLHTKKLVKRGITELTNN